MTNKLTFFAPQLYMPNGTFDISFYEKGLSAIEIRRFSNDDGSIHVAELSINDNIFHIHEEKKTAGRFSPETAKGTTVIIGLFVEDVDTCFEKAISAGATIVSQPISWDYGYRQAEIKDPFGHLWLIEKKI